MERRRIIRDAVHGVCEIDPKLRPILDTKEVQRLRWIRQTGLAFLVFPSAEHSRFSHVLGTYTLATRVFQHLRGLADEFAIDFSPFQLSDDLMKVFQTAALCHDLGHTAFSHLFEPMLLPEKIMYHEECTLALLQNENGDLAKQITNWCDLDEVIQLLKFNHPVIGLCNLLSGDYDVDRWDYLLRDAKATGVEYGVYDLPWMIHSLLLRRNSEDRPLVVLDGSRGVVALSQFLAARRYMYQCVYWHGTVRGAERMLRTIFERSADNFKRPDCNVEFERSLTPEPLRRSLSESVRPSMAEFIDTDDTVILTAVRSWASKTQDEILKYLCQRFLNRRLPKEVILKADIRNGERDLPRNFLNSVKDAVRAAMRDELPSNVLEDALDYLILLDRVRFRTANWDNIYFEVDDSIIQAQDMLEREPELGYGNAGFSLVRLYVPEQALESVRALAREG